MNKKIVRSPSRKAILGIIYIMLLFVIPEIFQILQPQWAFPGSPRELLLFEVYPYLILTGTVVYALKIEKCQFLPFNANVSNDFSWYVRNTLILFFTIFMIAWLAGLVSKLVGANMHSDKIDRIRALVHDHRWIILLLAFRAGVVEELLFRGYVFTRLEKIFKRSYPAIFLSSLFFALLHISYGTLGELIFPFIFGILLSWHYYKYRNIYILIFVHFLWDFMSMSMTM